MESEFGVTHLDQGVMFRAFSAYAESVQLCLFDPNSPSVELSRYELKADGRGAWSIVLPEVPVGTPYGYRVDGPFHPEDGHLFNPHKLLFDPYAKAVARIANYHNSMRSVELIDGVWQRNNVDSANFAPLAAVPEPIEKYCHARPGVELDSLLIYELHAKGMTALNPLIDEHLRGTYLGLSQPAVIKYLQDLGVTAIELLPVHFHFDEEHLVKKGLSNYWGYSTLGFFMPDPRYATGESLSAVVREFRQMVAAFHRAGIEVIIDVVFNHTCEGGPDAATVSLRGFDNATYYRLDQNDRSRYSDYTGCGNSIDTRHPHVVSMIIDSLRYWVEYLGVDGFRFDLAPVLSRGRFDMDPRHGFLQVLAHDAVLAGVKVFAEPWDMGTYQLGHYPEPWQEWNGQYRDAVRSYWRNDPRSASRFATRLSGSSDLFHDKKQSAHAGVNFITCHDGFTLRDLVTYERKHNEANLESNRDGSNDNRSWNCGVEGESSKAEINELRLQQQKNFLLTLYISVGIPMLLAGDEISRTQKGNNNAYCQDNEISWFPWSTLDGDRDLRKFVKELGLIRNENPTFRRREFFRGVPLEGQDVDIRWWQISGQELEQDNWSETNAFAALYGRDESIGQLRRILVCFNPGTDKVKFIFPEEFKDANWEIRLYTSVDSVSMNAGSVELSPNSALLLQSA